MIIFGYHGGKRKDLGEAMPMRCPRCNNDTFYRYMTVTSWFGLFFIPILPLKRRDYLVCPICTRALELRRDQREMAWRPGRADDHGTGSGEMAEADYQTQLRALTGQRGWVRPRCPRRRRLSCRPLPR